jgi:hypothetical protein
LRADLERAEQAEGAVREMLSSATAQHSELEHRMQTCQAEATSERSSASSVGRQREAQSQHAEALRNAATRFGESVRSQVDLLVRGLLETGTGRDSAPPPPSSEIGAQGALASREPGATASSSKAPVTPPRQPEPLEGTSSKTEGDEPEGTAVSSQDAESAATQARVATPVAPGDAADKDADASNNEAPSPQPLKESLTPQVERQSPLSLEAPPPTIPAQVPAWSLCILGNDVQAPRTDLDLSPCALPAPADTAVLVETATSPEGASPTKRMRLS